MRKVKSCFLIAFVVSIGLAAGAQAADFKVGIVDFQRVVEQSEPGQKVEAGLKQEGGRMEAELQKDKEELDALKEKLEREAMVMSREAREEKEIEFRVKVRNLQEKEKSYREDLRNKQRQEVNTLRAEVLEIAQEIGKAEGFALVISRVGVLYHDPAVDLTDRVVQALNKRMAGKAAQ